MGQEIRDSLTAERAKYILQQAVLKHYPNPNRQGCFDSLSLRDVASQRLPHKDLRWEHISHCSPCYGEFVAFRKETHASRTRHRFKVWPWTVVLLLLVGAALVARYFL
jgi:hypothetical protein